MTKLSTLLAQRQALLQQTRVANLAFAYVTLTGFRDRIARAGIRGGLVLSRATPEAERYWPTLTALDGAQSVIEEHFTDEDLMEVADVLAFLQSGDAPEVTFKAEDLDETFLAPVRTELATHGVVIDSSDARRDALR